MPELGFVVLLVLVAEFVNGSTDAPNAIATIVSTRVMRPIPAVLMATALNIAGAFFGTSVAITIAKGILSPDATITLHTIAAAMIAIIAWSTFAWYHGIPTSESHALVSGLAGAGLASGGLSALEVSGWIKVAIGLVFSTFVGFFLAYFLIVVIMQICRRWLPTTVRAVFGRLQILSAGFMAFGHGTNDGQKFIGVLVLALILGGQYDRHLLVVDPGGTKLVEGSLVSPDEVAAAERDLAGGPKPTTQLYVPRWVILACAMTMGLGTAAGGWRIIRTMGLRLVRLEPHHGFAAETASATAIQIASTFGIPLSTTHTINTAIMGVGATKRLSAVRWGLAREIVLTWILTFPVCGLVGFVMYELLLLVTRLF